MTSAPYSTPPGWYDDGLGQQRYWDGSAWTQYVHHAAAGAGNGDQGGARTESQHGTEQGAGARAIWSAVGKPLTGVGAGRYTLTAEYLLVEKGSLSTTAQQIRTREIYDVDAHQSMAQKTRKVGTITLFARRPGGDEQVTLADVPDFRSGIMAINRAADASREALRVRQNTQQVNYATQPTVAGTGTGAGVGAGNGVGARVGAGLNEELVTLAGLHDRGILTDEEFTAAKRRLLGL